VVAVVLAGSMPWAVFDSTRFVDVASAIARGSHSFSLRRRQHDGVFLVLSRLWDCVVEECDLDYWDLIGAAVSEAGVKSPPLRPARRCRRR
jgi:drug/metabolite transporter superfamily protein YnfA